MPNKNKSLIIALPLLAGMIFPAVAERKISTLTEGWEFTQGAPGRLHEMGIRQSASRLGYHGSV